MHLTELAYNCVKNVSLFDDDGFTLEKFIEINTDSSSEDYFDYSIAINNVFAPINEAIARLSDLDRIPCRVEEMTSTNGVIDLSTLTEHPCKEVMNVATIDLDRLPFIPYGINKIKITRPRKSNGHVVYNNVYPFGEIAQLESGSHKILVEYKEDIPYFTSGNLKASVSFSDESGDSISWNNEIELRDYGITDSMCNYIIEYAKGVLLEQVDAGLANMHITRAEQYFNNIRVAGQSFSQQVVTKKYRIG